MGLIVLRVPIVAMLFQRGLFSVADTAKTAEALLWYTVGLWAFSGLKVVTQAFFALKDTTTPVWTAVIAVAVNVGAGLLLMGPWQQGGLAAATSLAAAANFVILFCILAGRLDRFPIGELAGSVLRTCAASAAMGGALVFGTPLGDWTRGLNSWNCLVITALVLGGAGVFAAVAYLLGCREESKAIFGMVRRSR